MRSDGGGPAAFAAFGLPLRFDRDRVWVAIAGLVARNVAERIGRSWSPTVSGY